MCISAGIIAWVAVGPMLQWSNEWQLYINTAVALELTLMMTFLQNTMRRHRMYLNCCSEQIEMCDRELTEWLCNSLSEQV